MILSNPGRAGFNQEVDSLDEAKKIAASWWFDCAAQDVVERESPDGGTVYLYGSEEDADNDLDGAYTAQVTV